MIEAREHTDKYRIAGTKRLSQTSLRAYELSIDLHPFRERFEWWIFGGKGCRSFRAVVHLAIKDGCDQIGALGKSTKKRAHADPCTVGNFTGRGIHARRGEQLSRRRNYSVHATLSVGTQAAFAVRFRQRISPLGI
ncbi:MAG TPA: hypothetical protein VNT30_06975 [Stellaceae bacterium]|nr:hypothetical protein [Stellaceae bacterium]